MDESVALRGTQRKRLLGLYRGAADPAVRLRAHIILLLADGYTWAAVARVLFCSTRTIARWKGRFEAGGVAALSGEARGRRPVLASWWLLVVVRWVTCRTPRDFGYCRSRWSCECLALVLRAERRVRVSRETVRRWLRRGRVVWRRPRPVPGPKDPLREAKLRALRRLLGRLPADEVAVFQDEVDVNSNPDVGFMWMRRGRQALLVTPGTNAKRYVAGSLCWRTGRVVVTEGAGRNADLFLRHLDDLRRHYRRYRVIHVICDNAGFHTPAGSKKVARYLGEWGHRVVVHYLPKYSPDTNPIERVWWHLHEEVTRCHRCRSIDELVKLVMAWLDEKGAFEIEGDTYPRAKAA